MPPSRRGNQGNNRHLPNWRHTAHYRIFPPKTEMVTGHLFKVIHLSWNA
jgi:hypothetical protein